MSTPHIVCLSWSYQTAPVELRSAIAQAVAQIRREYRHVPGFVSLSTCNRIELYLNTVQFPLSVDDLFSQISKLTATPVSALRREGRQYEDEQACAHLLRVAAGLESMVLGESQILGQVKDAWEQAISEQTVCRHLYTLFQAAVRTGKRVRTQTGISRHSASMSSVAINVLLQHVEQPQNVHALVIGYGDMGRLALKALRARGVHHIGIANRRVERAAAEAEEYGYQLWGLDKLVEALSWADIVLSAAGAPEALVDNDLLREVMARRGDRPLVAVDIAVPQNISADAGAFSDFQLIGIDQLKRDVDRGLAARQQSVEDIIAQELTQLDTELQELTVRPLIRELRQKADAIRISELERTMRYMGDIDESTQEQLQRFSQALINKLLHEPTLRLRQKAAKGEVEPYAEAVRDLFNLASLP
ncbi:MAG: glutamyl-tRNA reductase [Chloroflexi bacterium]|nr:glutamyl-tRNA reductase [Chloroflexota bacterium]